MFIFKTQNYEGDLDSAKRNRKRFLITNKCMQQNYYGS